MAQIIDLKNKGLYTFPNRLGSVPQGAMVRALNGVIEKDDVFESRRGSKKYGAVFASALKKQFSYKGRILAHFSTTLAYDSDGAGTWVNYSGTFTAPSGEKIRSTQANQNLYLTSDVGIRKLDSLTATPTMAGSPKGLDGIATLSGATGFMANNTQVAYRIVWGYKDANNNLVLGAPSQRITVANASGGTRDISLAITIPSTITTSYFYQAYRSSGSASSATEPNDELQLVLEKNPTSGEVAARTLTVIDSTPDSLRGATLYTSPSEQGIAQSNDVPPLAKDIAVYKDMMLFANTQSNQRLSLTLISVGLTSFNYYDVTGDITNGGNQILNLSSTSGIAIGQLITGAGIQANTKVTNIAGTTITMSLNATANTIGVALRFRDLIIIDSLDYAANNTEVVGSRYFQVFTAGTPADNIANTALSLVKIINQATGVDVYAYYVSGYADLPGKMVIEDRVIGGSSWAVTSSKGGSFSPTVPTTGTTVSSSNEIKKNAIYVSKKGQPEAVPLGQVLFAGSADEAIGRVVALRDSAFVLKTDGVFRITGTSPSDLQLTPFDLTTRIIGNETAVALNNQVYMYSDQGVCTISDTGVQVISRSIEGDLLQLSSDQFPNFETISFAVAYETSRQYILGTQTSTGDTYATQAWVYNSFTQAWTRWEMNRVHGIVNTGDDRIYWAQADENYVRRERKEFLITDYAEDEFSVSITAFSGLSVDLNSTTNAVAGQTLAQDANGTQAKVVSVNSATNITVDRVITWTVAAATLYNPYTVGVEWVPIHGGNPGLVKHFPEATFFFRDATFASINVQFASNFSAFSSAAALRPVYLGAWGLFPWGGAPWGGGPPSEQPIRTYIPMEQQRAHWLQAYFEHTEALTKLGISGMSVVAEGMSTRMV